MEFDDIDHSAPDPTFVEMAVDPVQARMQGWTVHKDLYFDVPFISQIDGNLWQGGCEDGLLLPDFVDHVVSLYPWESYTLHGREKSVLSVWMRDSTSQSFAPVDSIARWVNDKCELENADTRSEQCAYP